MKHLKRVFAALLAAAVVLPVFGAGTAKAEKKELFKAESDEYCAVRADADFNGDITAEDARILLRIAVGLQNPDESRPYYYMADGDKAVTAEDARIALRIAVGLQDRPAHVKRRDVVLAKPTCAEAGVSASQCRYCGDLYDFGVLPQQGHVGAGWVTVKQPTCTEKGLMEQRCVFCDQVIETRSVAKTPHILGGMQYVSPTPDCTKTEMVYFKCLNCDYREEKLRPSGEHNFNMWVTDPEPTCVTQGVNRLVCSVCGREDPNTLPEILPAYGHTPSDWIVVKQPTKTAKGLRQIQCTECGAVLSMESIPKVSK